MTKYLIFFLSLVAFSATAFYVFTTRNQTTTPLNTEPTPTQIPEITNFEECVAAGFPVMESMPRQCRAGTETFAEERKVTATPVSSPSADIQISSPQEGAAVSSPLTVTGQAVGNWYFEGQFPIELSNQDDIIIASASAEAQEDWMTESLVPFKATLTFQGQSAGSDLTLALKKANPSGLPQNADIVRLPLTVK